MIFKYSKKINKEMWNEVIGHKEMFGMKFPDKISITKKDEKTAEDQIKRFETNWNYNEKELKKTIFKIYGFKIPKVIICYINTSKFSSVCRDEKHITVSMHRPNLDIARVIIHEFSHVAFYRKWGDFCKKIGYTDEGIEEVKEVLTVINNIELEGIIDNGYPIHKDIREIVKNMWLETHSLEKIISDPKIINLVNSLNTIIKK